MSVVADSVTGREELECLHCFENMGRLDLLQPEAFDYMGRPHLVTQSDRQR